MGTALSLDADYISTHANVIADDISRLKRSAEMVNTTTQNY
jgi:hypothetical protein